MTIPEWETRIQTIKKRMWSYFVANLISFPLIIPIVFYFRHAFPIHVSPTTFRFCLLLHICLSALSVALKVWNQRNYVSNPDFYAKCRSTDGFFRLYNGYYHVTLSLCDLTGISGIAIILMGAPMIYLIVSATLSVALLFTSLPNTKDMRSLYEQCRIMHPEWGAVFSLHQPGA